MDPLRERKKVVAKLAKKEEEQEKKEEKKREKERQKLEKMSLNEEQSPQPQQHQ